MTHPGGRPTKLTPEIFERCKDYIKGAYLIDELFPTLAGLAVFLGIRKSTLYEWSKENPEFSDFCADVMTMQEKYLVRGGTEGVYNSTITKLMLTKHGYTDKQETAHTGADGSPLGITVSFVKPDKA